MHGIFRHLENGRAEWRGTRLQQKEPIHKGKRWTYMDEVMPQKAAQCIDAKTDGEEVLDTLVDMGKFLPEKKVMESDA